MRAILCTELTGPAGLRVVDDLPPPVPGPGEVRVGVAWAAMNFMDTLITTGRYQFKPPLPFVPGHDAAGTVLALGAGVQGLQVGQRVSVGVTTGAYAEQLVAPAHRVVPLPEGVPLQAAAAYRASHCSAYHALLQRGGLQAGDKLVVTGAAGGVGQAALQLARVVGAAAVGVVRDAGQADAVAAQGATPLVCAEPRELAAALRALWPQGFDVALDIVGGPGQVELVRAAGWGARILVLGFGAGIPEVPSNRLLLQGCALVGVNYGAAQDRDPAVTRALHATLLGWMAEGRVQPRIDAELPLHEAAAGLQRLAAGDVVGKLLLRVGG